MTSRPQATDQPPPTELDRLVGWLDERTGIAAVARTVLRKVFPDHWSFLLGEIALFCYVVLVATGVFLTFFFAADTRPYWVKVGSEAQTAWGRASSFTWNTGCRRASGVRTR